MNFQNGDLHWFCGKTTFINIYLLNGVDALKLLLFSRHDFHFGHYIGADVLLVRLNVVYIIGAPSFVQVVSKKSRGHQRLIN